MIIVACCIVQGVHADGQSQEERNTAMAVNIVDAFKKAAVTKEFIEWQMNFSKHCVKGLVLLMHQAKPHLTQEEQELVKKTLVVLTELVQLFREFCADTRRLLPSKMPVDVYMKYMKKFNAKCDSFKSSLSIFKNYLPELQKQDNALLLISEFERLSVMLNSCLTAATTELS